LTDVDSAHSGIAMSTQSAMSDNRFIT